MEFLRKNFKSFDKKSGIYLIKIKDHKYVGSAKNLRNRLNQHEWSLKVGRHHNQTLQNCYNKYTVEKVSFEILEECAVEDLLVREAYYIEFLHADMNHIKDPMNVTMDEISRHRLKSSLRKHYAVHEPTSNKKVYQYSIEGVYIGEFKSVAEASRQTGIHNSSICNVCRDLKGTAGNYQWRYEKSDRIDTYKPNIGVKPILQIDPVSGEIIKTWKTQSAIETELGYRQKFISAACESGEVFKGFLWKKGESKKDLKKKKPKFIPGIPVHQYDLQGNYVQSFNSAKEAERVTGIHGNTICRSMLPNTPNKSAGGFIWSTEKVDKVSVYQNFSDKAKIRKIWVFDTFTGEELEFESIAEAVRTLNPSTTNFDGDCATLSHCASGSGFYKQYLARNEDSNYQLTTRNIQLYNSVTGEIFSNVKDAVKKTNNSSWMIKKWASDEANKEWFYLNDCARVKLRESGKTFS